MKGSSRKAEYSTLLAALLTVVIYAYGQSDLDFLHVASNILAPVLAFLALEFAVLLMVERGIRKGATVSAIWVGYSLGMLAWFLGESAWTTYVLLLGVEIPYPSIADAFWLAGYLPFFWALLLQFWPYREELSSREVVLGGIFILGLASALLVILVPPVLAEEDLVTQVVSLAYPLLDAVLLVTALPTFILFRKGTFWKPTLAIILGILLSLAGDLLFSLTTLYGAYYDGHPLELLFLWSYLMFALGFYTRLRTSRVRGAFQD